MDGWMFHPGLERAGSRPQAGREKSEGKAGWVLGQGSPSAPVRTAEPSLSAGGDAAQPARTGQWHDPGAHLWMCDWPVHGWGLSATSVVGCTFTVGVIVAIYLFIFNIFHFFHVLKGTLEQ